MTKESLIFIVLYFQPKLLNVGVLGDFFKYFGITC